MRCEQQAQSVCRPQVLVNCAVYTVLIFAHKGSKPHWRLSVNLLFIFFIWIRPDLRIGLRLSFYLSLETALMPWLFVAFRARHYPRSQAYALRKERLLRLVRAAAAGVAWALGVFGTVCASIHIFTVLILPSSLAISQAKAVALMLSTSSSSATSM